MNVMSVLLDSSAGGSAHQEDAHNDNALQVLQSVHGHKVTHPETLQSSGISAFAPEQQ